MSFTSKPVPFTRAFIATALYRKKNHCLVKKLMKLDFNSFIN